MRFSSRQDYNPAVIDSTSGYILDQMLRYDYVLSPTINPDSGYIAYATDLGTPLYIEKDSTSGLLLLNASATAVSTPIPVGKASVYYLNSLVPAAADSLPALLQSDSTLTFFAAAMAITNLYNSTLLTGSYTILAPINSAFINAGYDSLPAIDSANVDTLIALMQGQIIKGFYLTNSFPIPGPVFDVLGNPVTVALNNGLLAIFGQRKSRSRELAERQSCLGRQYRRTPDGWFSLALGIARPEGRPARSGGDPPLYI